MTIDPELDLQLTRDMRHSPEAIWSAWTDAEKLKKWFVPAPWRTASVVIEAHPGGRFDTVMEGPDGERHESQGCVLEAIPHRRLVFTDGLTRGFRPAKSPFMTAIITLEPNEGGTDYMATVLHADAEACNRHRDMGFEFGWNAALDQMVALLEDQ